MTGLRTVAVVPAFNESGAIGRVVGEIGAARPGIDVVVVDDASTDDTAAVAEAAGATVLRLAFNVGIGGAVQTGFRYALEEGYERAVRLDGDGNADHGSQLNNRSHALGLLRTGIVMGPSRPTHRAGRAGRARCGRGAGRGTRPGRPGG